MDGGVCWNRLRTIYFSFLLYLLLSSFFEWIKIKQFLVFTSRNKIKIEEKEEGALMIIMIMHLYSKCIKSQFIFRTFFPPKLHFIFVFFVFVSIVIVIYAVGIMMNKNKNNDHIHRYISISIPYYSIILPSNLIIRITWHK